MLKPLCFSGTAVRLSPGITATVKGKLSIGARVLQLGGIERVFRILFSWEDGEKLMESFECYWSTSTSPIAAGLLFISTEKVAFWSERSVDVVSPDGESTKIHYKVILHKLQKSTLFPLIPVGHSLLSCAC